jgi:KDO2-lipid IV(A) lauroyltransferase
MNRVLDEGGILGLASDQDVKNRGVFVRFFNILSSTPKGAARFYQQKGSIPIFGVCSKEGHNQFLIKFKDIPKESLADTKTFTQKYTQLLENEIRIHPEQYFWWHNRWKTPPLVK